MRFFLILALIISVAIIVFTAQNQTEITLQFINWDLVGPLPVMLAVPFFVGTIAGVVLIIPAWLKKSKSVKTHKKRIHELEAEVASLSEQIESEEPEVEQIEQDIAKDNIS